MVEDTLTYDQSPPFRPGLSDLQNALKTDDEEFPPDDTEMPFAAEANQQAVQIASISKTREVGLVAIHFTAGTPAVFQQSCAQSLEPTFTVQDLGNGDTRITWPANTFPNPVVPATAHLTADVDATIACIAITNGVEVKTRVAGVGTDADFVVVVR